MRWSIPMTDPWCWYINANIKGVYWWDPCYHILQHHGSVMGYDHMSVHLILSYPIWSHSHGHLLSIAFGMLLLGVECPNLKTTLSSLMRSTGFERTIRHGISANSLRQTAAYPMQCASKVAKTGFGWPMTQSLPENFGNWSYLFSKDKHDSKGNDKLSSRRTRGRIRRKHRWWKVLPVPRLAASPP